MEEGVHVFAGKFESLEEAVLYTEAQWEPEPEDGVSEEVYSEWEERNPIWPLRADLDAYLDSDFIETIDGADRYSYLEEMLANPSEIESIRKAAPAEANILVLIFHQALDGFPASLRSTPRLTYCGEYACSS